MRWTLERRDFGGGPDCRRAMSPMATWYRALSRILAVSAVMCMAANVVCTTETVPEVRREAKMENRPIETVLDEHAKELMAIPGVVGVGIGKCGDTPCIRVMVSENNETIAKNVPPRIEGHKTDIVETGGFRALPDQ
jgi:hypothetical protein